MSEKKQYETPRLEELRYVQQDILTSSTDMPEIRGEARKSDETPLA